MVKIPGFGIFGMMPLYGRDLSHFARFGLRTVVRLRWIWFDVELRRLGEF